MKRYLQRSVERAVRALRDAAAIETGAIEKLYDLDRGITITAAAQGAVMETVLAGQSEKVRSLIDSQLKAYDYVLDFATGNQEIAETWIRSLHDVLCRAQSHYQVVDKDGSSHERPLAHGTYKTEPNHVQKASGSVHYYAPVSHTAPEMRRLVEILRSKEFSAAHPVDQAAFAHYAFVAIHPFSDGNGRMARALASVFTYRAYRIPLLITVDQRTSYFDALEQADAGEFQSFRLFVRERIVDSIGLLAESLRNAQVGTASASASAVKDLLYTRGGYLHTGVDHVAPQLLASLEKFIGEEVAKAKGAFDRLACTLETVHATRRTASPATHRHALNERMLRIRFEAPKPIKAVNEMMFAVAVPKDAAPTDEFIIECGVNSPELQLRILVRNVLPKRTLTADIALKMFAERLVAALLKNLGVSAEKSLRGLGY